MTKTAMFMAKMRGGFSGDAKLYKLSEPVSYELYDADGGHTTVETSHVIVSAVIAPFTGPETYIFPADESGAVLNWAELDGSYRGGLSHETALRYAGFEVVDLVEREG